MVLGAVGGLVLFLTGLCPPSSRPISAACTPLTVPAFVVLSRLYGWWIEGRTPGRADLAGAVLCMLGLAESRTGRAGG